MAEGCWGVEVVVRHGVTGFLGLLPLGVLCVFLVVEPIEERETGIDAMGYVDAGA